METAPATAAGRVLVATGMARRACRGQAVGRWWPGLVLVGATALPGSPVDATAPAPMVSTAETPIEVAVRVAAPGSAPETWTWTACGLEDRSVPGDREGGSASGTPSAMGLFRIVGDRVDVDVELPATAGVERPKYRGRGLAIGSADAALAPVGTGGARVTATVERAEGRHVEIRAVNSTLAGIARGLARAAAIRIDGIEQLAAEQITLDFGCVAAETVIGILAFTSDRMVFGAGEAHWGFSDAASYEDYTALQAKVAAAREADDLDAEYAAQLQLVALAMPRAQGPVMLVDDPWGDAARIAAMRDDLAAAERLMRERLVYLERRNGNTEGGDYGLALAKVGRLRILQEDSTSGADLVERGLAIAARDPRQAASGLAPFLGLLAGERQLAGRHAEAASLYQQAVAAYGDVGDDFIAGMGLSASLQGLAYAYIGQERLADALPLLERRLALEIGFHGDDSGMAARAQDDLAEVLYRNDELARSYQLTVRAMAGDGAGERAARNGALRIATIDALGRFAADQPPPSSELEVLRERLRAGVDADVLYEMMTVLERRAARQRRESP